MSEKMIVACPECRTRFVAPLEKFLPGGRKVRCAKCGNSWFQRPDGANLQTATAAPAAQPVPESGRASDLTGTTPDPARADSGISVIERAEQRRAAMAATSATVAGTTSVQEMEPVVEQPATPSPEPAKITEAPSDSDTEYTGSTMPQPDPVAIPRRRSFWPRALFYTLAAAIIAGCAGYFFKDPLSEKFPSLAPHLTTWHDKVDGVVGAVIPSKRALRIENMTYSFKDIEGGRALLVDAQVLNDTDAEKDAPNLTVKVLGPDKAVLKQVDIGTEDMSEKIAALSSAPYHWEMPLPPEDMQGVQVEFAK